MPFGSPNPWASVSTISPTKIVAIAQKLGTSEVLTLLENIRFLGYDVAMSRLIGGKPVIEIDRDKSDARPVVSPVAATIAASPRT
jgi:hypothetical protein